MNKLKNYIGFLLLAGIGFACTTTQKTSTASKSFSEDISEFRPKIDTVTVKSEEEVSFRKTEENFNPKYDVTELLNEKLDSLAFNNADIAYVNGYSIQIYSGSSSAEAYQARDTAMILLPEIRTNVQYQQPVYKVRVGSFTERLEVQRTLLKLKPKFPSAISVPSRIKVN
ncbi:hypothetical protein GCM10011506_31190 [Marivirga lumbricoides]|uniref:SPOR domain-containing protein n=1 Tax=Marivirga lumbricoides TaxID=1046115 RepID=A0ABQ1MMS8_9BACT|nr:hypothetical protein GCM10011506_31190 [Marivirga lumbricoides]